MNALFPKQTSKATLLVVDDDEIDREIILRALAEHGLEVPVAYAANGNEAIEIMKSETDTAFVVLLDLNMPVLDGFETLDVMRNDPDLMKTPVFILSTSDEERDIDQSYRMGISGYLRKAEIDEGMERIISLMRAYIETVKLP
ncbi:MAG: response regulator [Pseudomonadota bacterium]|nr:response regulator [Pseudomonadota bacterium]